MSLILGYEKPLRNQLNKNGNLHYLLI